ncbi:hypothetical protein CBR_g36818 [Chara braunii]|uniref:Uncharacterized protein n=1 Tax=Chara braunii TaxID=69332 RepID=A0A388LLM7_CHABU|nr:hypothetical protein CBR_g36818 [Chara braunii]|eukprot:GBG83204.1 hypothetical protein CBR_g36818 [Chara braunii]
MSQSETGNPNGTLENKKILNKPRFYEIWLSANQSDYPHVFCKEVYTGQKTSRQTCHSQTFDAVAGNVTDNIDVGRGTTRAECIGTVSTRARVEEAGSQTTDIGEGGFKSSLGCSNSGELAGRNETQDAAVLVSPQGDLAAKGTSLERKTRDPENVQDMDLPGLSEAPSVAIGRMPLVACTSNHQIIPSNSGWNASHLAARGQDLMAGLRQHNMPSRGGICAEGLRLANTPVSGVAQSSRTCIFDGSDMDGLVVPESNTHREMGAPALESDQATPSVQGLVQGGRGGSTVTGKRFRAGSGRHRRMTKAVSEGRCEGLTNGRKKRRLTSNDTTRDINEAFAAIIRAATEQFAHAIARSDEMFLARQNEFHKAMLEQRREAMEMLAEQHRQDIIIMREMLEQNASRDTAFKEKLLAVLASLVGNGQVDEEKDEYM